MAFLRLFAVFPFLLILVLLVLQVCGQDIEVVTPAGKKVILKPDRTWVYKDDFLLSLPKPQGGDPIAKPFITADIDLILDAYSKVSTLKSEFETEEEYSARIRAMAESVLVKGEKTKDVFLYLPLNPDYSAEKKKFSFFLNVVGIPRAKKSRISIVLVAWDCRNSIERSMSIGKGIPCGGFVWSQDWRFKYSFPYVDMASDEARIMKSRLKLAVSGIPVGFDEYGNLRLKIISWIIFDTEVGKIYNTGKIY